MTKSGLSTCLMISHDWFSITCIFIGTCSNLVSPYSHHIWVLVSLYLLILGYTEVLILRSAFYSYLKTQKIYLGSEEEKKIETRTLSLPCALSPSINQTARSCLPISFKASSSFPYVEASVIWDHFNNISSAFCSGF